MPRLAMLTSHDREEHEVERDRAIHGVGGQFPPLSPPATKSSRRNPASTPRRSRRPRATLAGNAREGAGLAAQQQPPAGEARKLRTSSIPPHDVTARKRRQQIHAAGLELPRRRARRAELSFSPARTRRTSGRDSRTKTSVCRARRRRPLRRRVRAPFHRRLRCSRLIDELRLVASVPLSTRPSATPLRSVCSSSLRAFATMPTNFP